MKFIAVSQRVDVLPERNERRDALDRRYAELLAAIGFATLPVPNLGPPAVAALGDLPLAGLLLSGGNDLVAVGGDAPERDATEAALLDLAVSRRLPVLGICRGMQFFAAREGITLVADDRHAGSRHELRGEIAREVNSYHRWCVPATTPQWDTLAVAADGSIEAMRHRTLPWLGIMWHPERESPFAAADLALLREIWEHQA
jgi:N5-(cytidine 5'-diphosphoramidyl)-L-glutamine hydrolase